MCQDDPAGQGHYGWLLQSSRVGKYVNSALLLRSRRTEQAGCAGLVCVCVCVLRRRADESNRRLFSRVADGCLRVCAYVACAAWRRPHPRSLCTVSGEVLLNPVLSPVSGCVFERALIEKHLADNGGLDPIANQPLTADQLIAVKGTPCTTAPSCFY